jgi:thiol:disulfide interchange protein DsbC
MIMSLMSKLSAILISASLLGSCAYAETAKKGVETQEQKVLGFLKNMIGRNPNIISLDVSIVNKIPLDEPKGWDAYVIMLDGKVKAQGQERPVKQQQIYFVNGDIMTPELHNIRLKRRVNELISPAFSDAFYSKDNLIYGSADAKHKVVIFSDPLCPFCRRYVPEALNEMKAQPETYAVYYYHLPLAALHPAAVALTKAAIVAEQQGVKEVVLNLYKVQINSKETDEKKILDAFNATLGTKITVEQIHAKAVEEQARHDQGVAMKMMVSGTPTVFFDGKKDPSKTQYKQFKGKE